MKLLVLLISVLAVQTAVPELNDGNFMTTVSADPLQMWMVFFHADWVRHLVDRSVNYVSSCCRSSKRLRSWCTTWILSLPRSMRKITQQLFRPTWQILKLTCSSIRRFSFWQAVSPLLSLGEAIGKVPGQIRNSYGMQHWFLNYFKVVEWSRIFDPDALYK